MVEESAVDSVQEIIKLKSVNASEPPVSIAVSSMPPGRRVCAPPLEPIFRPLNRREQFLQLKHMTSEPKGSSMLSVSDSQGNDRQLTRENALEPAL